MNPSTPSCQPLIRQHGDARRVDVGPVAIRVVLSHEDTGGAIEALEFTAGQGSPGPTLHTHATATETFFVLEGALLVHAGGKSELVRAGGVANVPPRVPHKFEYPGPGPTRFLVTLTPAIGMDRYFETLRSLVQQGWPPPPEKMAALLAKFDVAPA